MDPNMSWLGMDVSMEKLYAAQFDFLKGMVVKCGVEFQGIHEHLARHDEDRVLIEELQVRADQAEKAQVALEGKVEVLTARVDEIPSKIAEAVAEAVEEMEAKMAAMRHTISAQASRIQVLENIEAQRCQHNSQRQSKKSQFWQSKKPNVMAHLRAVAKVASHHRSDATPQAEHEKMAAAITANDHHVLSLSAPVEELHTSVHELRVPEHQHTELTHTLEAAASSSAPPPVSAHAVPSIVAGGATTAAVDANPNAAPTAAAAPPPPIQPPAVHHPSSASSEGAAQAAPPATDGGSSYAEAATTAPSPTGEAATAAWLRTSWSSDYLGDTHDEHDARVNQWIEDTDHALQTYAKQIAVLTNLTSVQRVLIQDGRDKTVALEQQMSPLMEAMQKVEETLRELPAMQEKLIDLEDGAAETNAEVGRLQIVAREASEALQQLQPLMHELREWRDEYVTQQEGEHTKHEVALEEVRRSLGDEMAKMQAAFAEAEALLESMPDAAALDSFVDKEALAAAVDDVTLLLRGQLDKSHELTKAEIVELEARLAGISSAGDSSETMEALKESLFLMDSKIGAKANIDELAALRAAVKKLANLRSTASSGSLTAKSISMCLACNRPIYQSTETPKSSANNSRMGHAGTSMMAERHRQTGVYKMDTSASAFVDLVERDSQAYSSERPSSRSGGGGGGGGGSSRASSRGGSREQLRSPAVNLSSASATGSAAGSDFFLPSLPPRSISRVGSRSVTPM